MTLPPLPKNRNWSPETWRAGLDEAVRLATSGYDSWTVFSMVYHEKTLVAMAIIAHATTLIAAGIVKPVVSREAVTLLKAACDARDVTMLRCLWQDPAAIAVIQSALDKARAGE